MRIPKSNDVHSLKNGDTYIRHGRQNTKIGSSEIIRLKYEKGSIKFESEPSQISTPEELDEPILKRFQNDIGSATDDIWQCLKDNGLAKEYADKMYLTKGGALVFARNPSVSLGSKSGIKISHYYGVAQNYTGEPNFVRRPFTIEGPLLIQIEKTMDYFREAVKNSPPKLIGAEFRPSLMIPEWAFQEAITNAVIHRNYSVEDDIQLRIFDDRIEVESPGTYPGHITPLNIRKERFARNPLILRALNKFSSSPNLDIGEGVDRMFQVMHDNNLYEPLYIPPAIRPNSVLVMLLNMQKIEYWDVVSNYLDKEFVITNGAARKITGIGDSVKMSRLLKSWVDNGVLEIITQGSKRHTFYKKVGIDLPSKLLASFSN